MNKFFLLMEVLKHGQEVANKESWKKGQAYLQPILYALVVACIQLAQAFGFQVEIDSSVLVSIAGMLFFVGNTVVTLITTKSIGLPVFGKGCSSEPPVYGVVENPSVVENIEDFVSPVVEREVTERIATAVEQQSDESMAAALDWIKRHSGK